MSDKMTAVITFIVGGLVLLSVPLILVMTFVAANRSHRRKVAEWRLLPTLDEYLTQHPECKTEEGPICSACHGAKLYQRGLNGVTSKQRIHVCDSCSTDLFRSGG